MNTFTLFQRVIAVCSFILCMFAGTAVQAKEKAALLFIPLDNRPVCFSYPVKVMEAAGYKIYTPPEKLFSFTLGEEAYVQLREIITRYRRRYMDHLFKSERFLEN